MQFRKTSKILLMLSLVLVFSLMLTSVSFAQDDGLSDDEQALLDRVLNVVDSTDNYESFVATVHSVSTSSQDMVLGPVNFARTSSLTLDAVATVIQGDNPNGSATITASVENIDDDGTVAYDLEAEARYVDGVLYLNILSITGVEGLPAPDAPEGWQVADEMHPFYSDLDLKGFVDLFAEDALTVEEEVDVRDLLGTMATSVTVEEGEIDGVAVDGITIIVGVEGFITLMNEQLDTSDDPMQAALMDMMFGSLDESSDLVRYVIALDEDDNVLGVATALTFAIAELDLSSIDASLAGATLEFSIDEFDIIEYSQINETFERVEAPE